MSGKQEIGDGNIKLVNEHTKRERKATVTKEEYSETDNDQYEALLILPDNPP